MFTTALKIPHDILQPLEFVDFPIDKPDQWADMIGTETALVETELIGFETMLEHRVQFLFDKNGGLRDDMEDRVNIRALILEGILLYDGGMRYDRFIFGDVLLIGISESGAVDDVPRTVIDLAREAHNRGVVFSRKVQEFTSNPNNPLMEELMNDD